MKSFLIYALRRIFLLIPFLIGLTILAFLLGVLAPGDPVSYTHLTLPTT